jgi:hypothetical protein
MIAHCTSSTIVLGETEPIARGQAEYLTSLMPLGIVLAAGRALDFQLH